MIAPTLLEAVAATLGVINVLLIVRRSLWNYPFGIAMVTIYGFVFLESRLYADAALQVFFLLIQAYGWVNWRRSRRADGAVRATRAGPVETTAYVVGTAAAALGCGWLLATYTDAALPYWDALIASASVAAQCLLAMRRVENWIFWIGVDILGIAVFASRGLVVTAGLYGIFLVLATIGLICWWRALAGAGAPQPAS